MTVSPDGLLLLLLLLLLYTVIMEYNNWHRTRRFDVGHIYLESSIFWRQSLMSYHASCDQSTTPVTNFKRSYEFERPHSPSLDSNFGGFYLFIIVSIYRLSAWVNRSRNIMTTCSWTTWLTYLCGWGAGRSRARPIKTRCKSPVSRQHHLQHLVVIAGCLFLPGGGWS